MEEQKEPKKTGFLNVEVPLTMLRRIEEIVATDMHATKSEFVREAVREKIEKIEDRIKNRL